MTTTERLRALLDAAIPGPWHTPGISLRPYTIYSGDGNDLARAWDADDARLIAAAVNALPALLDVAEAARAYMERPAPRHTWDPALELKAALARLEAS